MSETPAFLDRLLNAVGPSGFEAPAAQVWRDEASTFADDVSTEVTGGVVAVVNSEGSPKVMLAGHIDEIGLQITHIDDDGFIYIDEIGGWDPQVLVGQRVRIRSRDGDVPGVIGKKAIHLISPEERSKATKTKDLWVDVGAQSSDEVSDLGIRVGDPMVIDSNVVSLAGDRISSRAIDNRIGAYVVLEALRLVSAGDPVPAAVHAVATSQEEIGYQGGGARASAFAIAPDVALVVDVTFATDVPDISKKEHGDHKLGGGPVLSRGSAAHPVVFDLLAEAAAEEGIDYSIQAAPKATRTDADGIHLVRSGIPTGLVSVPNRYMHSPNEVVSIADLHTSARLLAAFIRRLVPGQDFTP